MIVRIIKSPDSRTNADQRMLKPAKNLTVINVKIHNTSNDKPRQIDLDSKQFNDNKISHIPNKSKLGQYNILKVSKKSSDKNSTIASSSCCKIDLKDSLQKTSTFNKSPYAISPKWTINSNSSTQRNGDCSKETIKLKKTNSPSRTAFDKYKNSVAHKTYINNFTKSPTTLSDLIVSRDQSNCKSSMICNLKKSPVTIVSVKHLYNRDKLSSNVSNLKASGTINVEKNLCSISTSDLKEKLNDLGDRTKRIISLYKNRLNTIQ